MRLRFMFSTLFILASVVSPSPAFSQSTSPLTGGIARPASEHSQVMERTILIRPKESKTELSSRFYPSQDQLTKGNAAPILLRMNWEARHRMKVLYELFADEGLNTPLDEFDIETIDKNFPINLKEMNRAVFRERAGWEYPLHEEPQFDILLPDVQESRVYAHAMLLKARSLIKQGKIEQAERILCLTIGMARHVGETPFIVTRLVQYTQNNNALSVVEELLQHPESPNYYWDFVSMPKQLIDVRTAIQLESELLANSIPGLKELDDLKTEEQWRTLADKIWEALRTWNTATGNAALPQAGTPEALKAIEDWEAVSRERLPKLASELAPRMAQMSDAEVGVRYWWLRVQQRTKAHFAQCLLEPEYALPRVMEDLERMKKDAVDELPVQIGSPWVNGFVAAAALMDQRIVMLRAIESIRDHAARHEGKLPRSLDELELPLPRDPVSGKALQYEAATDLQSARLSGATVETSSGWFAGVDPSKKIIKGMRYELKIAER